MSVVKQDIVNSSCKVQMCSGQSFGSKAAIHAMRDLFEEEESAAGLQSQKDSSLRLNVTT